MGSEREGFLQHRGGCEKKRGRGWREGTPGRPLKDDADAGEITEEGLEVLVTLYFSFFYIYIL